MARNPLIRKKEKSYTTPMKNQSAGILDDYAVRKVVATKEGSITRTPTDDIDIANKAYVDSMDFWTRVGTTLFPKNTNDGITIGSSLFVDNLLSGNSFIRQRCHPASAQYWDNLAVGRDAVYRISAVTGADTTFMTVVPSGDVDFPHEVSIQGGTSQDAPVADKDIVNKEFVDAEIASAPYWHTTENQLGLTGAKSGSFNLGTTGTITAGNYLTGSLTLDAASITDNSGAISFGSTDLTTTGDGTFDQIGVGAPIVANRAINAAISVVADSGNIFAMRFAPSLTSAAATNTANLYGFYTLPRTGGSKTFNGKLIGMGSVPTTGHFTSKVLNRAVSFEARHQADTSGITTNAIGFECINSLIASTGNPVNLYAFYANEMTMGSSTNHQFYSVAGDNYFGNGTHKLIGTTNTGDGGTTNYTTFASNGDQTFTGSAGFYPREIAQDAEPAAGTGATQIDSGELAVWRDTNDSNKIFLVYNYNGTVCKVECG